MLLWRLLAAAVIVSLAGSGLYVLRTDARLAARVRTALHRRVTYLIGVPALALVMLVGVPFVYLESIGSDPPPPLSFADLPELPSTTVPTVAAAPDRSADTTVPADPGAGVPVSELAAPATTAPEAAPPTLPDIAGSWAVSQGTEARYNIDDTILGQTQRVVGRTSHVSGAMEVVGSTVTTANIVVNMRTVVCSCVHDSKYQDMLDIDQHPYSTFDLTTPITLPDLPAEGVVIEVPVTGIFTIHGVTREVSFTLSALREAGRIAINGLIPVRLEDYNIENPDAGAFGGLSNASIELLVAFERAG